jgi:hypothetical protein
VPSVLDGKPVVSVEQLEPGDILLFKDEGDDRMIHVAQYPTGRTAESSSFVHSVIWVQSQNPGLEALAGERPSGFSGGFSGHEIVEARGGGIQGGPLRDGLYAVFRLRRDRVGPLGELGRLAATIAMIWASGSTESYGMLTALLSLGRSTTLRRGGTGRAWMYHNDAFNPSPSWTQDHRPICSQLVIAIYQAAVLRIWDWVAINPRPWQVDPLMIERYHIQVGYGLTALDARASNAANLFDALCEDPRFEFGRLRRPSGWEAL